LSIVFNARKNAEQSKREQEPKAENAALPAAPQKAVAEEKPADHEKARRAAKPRRQSRSRQRIARSDASWTVKKDMAKPAKTARLPVVRSLLRTPHSGPHAATGHLSGPQRGGAVIQPAILVLRINPVYPALAKERAISGTVEVRFRINPEGKVYDVRPVNGSPILAAAAIEAVKGWSYEPARLNGAAIDSQASTHIDFNLE